MLLMIQKCSSWRVFSEFCENPTKPYQIKELAREIKLAPTSVRIHLNTLEKEGLIKKEKVGVYEAYKSNFEAENFRFYKKINNLLSIKESGIIRELENKTTPDAIILFGSYAKAEDTENSDIDLFLIAKEKQIDLKEYEKKLNRAIQLFFSEDLNKLPKELLNNILNGIVLSGFVRWIK